MKRKTLTLVLCLLATFALASIGFASWIIANPADINLTDEGSFTVYNATDSTASISVTFAGDKNSIIFGKPTEDKIATIPDPWLTMGSEMAEENLSVSLTVSESNDDYTGTLVVYLYVDNETYQKLEKAKTDKLINYSDDLFQAVQIGSTTYHGIKQETSNSTTLNLAFTWGEKFGKTNPYLHYNGGSYDANAAETLNSLLPLNNIKFNVLITEAE